MRSCLSLVSMCSGSRPMVRGSLSWFPFQGEASLLFDFRESAAQCVAEQKLLRFGRAFLQGLPTGAGRARGATVFSRAGAGAVEGGHLYTRPSYDEAPRLSAWPDVDEFRLLALVREAGRRSRVWRIGRASVPGRGGACGWRTERRLPGRAVERVGRGEVLRGRVGWSRAAPPE